MEPPEKPDESDCCNSGCHPCIFDVYEEQLKRYEKYLKNPVRETPISNCIDQLKYTRFKLVSKIEHTRDTYIFIFEYSNGDINRKRELQKTNVLSDSDNEIKFINDEFTETKTNNLSNCEDKLLNTENARIDCTLTSISKTNNLNHCENNVKKGTESENNVKLGTEREKNVKGGTQSKNNVKEGTESEQYIKEGTESEISVKDVIENNVKIGTECEHNVNASTESGNIGFWTLNDAQHSNNIISDKMIGYKSKETFSNIVDKSFQTEIKTQTASISVTHKSVESELFSKPAQPSNNKTGDKSKEFKCKKEAFGNIDKTEIKCDETIEFKSEKEAFGKVEKTKVVEPERDLLYKPGQHFLIKAYSQRDRIYFTRAYTPIPWEKIKPRQFAVLIRIYEKGEMSNYLKRLKSDSLTFWRGPYGDYELPKSPPKHLLLIAQGTGIAPIFSVLTSLLDDEDCEAFIKLFYCCRDCEDILLRENLYGFYKYWNFSCEVFVSRGGLKEVKYNEVVHEKKLDLEAVEGYTKGKEGCFEVMVCGSEGFEKFVGDCVKKCGASDV